MCIKDAGGAGMKMKMKMKMKKKVSPLPVSRQLKRKVEDAGLIPAKRKLVKRMMFDRIASFISSVVSAAPLFQDDGGDDYNEDDGRDI